VLSYQSKSKQDIAYHLSILTAKNCANEVITFLNEQPSSYFFILNILTKIHRLQTISLVSIKACIYIDMFGYINAYLKIFLFMR
jgi:hypothetical protein